MTARFPSSELKTATVRTLLLSTRSAVTDISDRFIGRIVNLGSAFSGRIQICADETISGQILRHNSIQLRTSSVKILRRMDCGVSTLCYLHTRSGGDDLVIHGMNSVHQPHFNQ